MKHITPEILRKAQALLEDGKRAPEGLWSTTCHVIQKASGQRTNDGSLTPIFEETCDLIREQVDSVWPFHVLGTQGMSQQAIQGGRFMYLELLALAIEDGCL